MQDNVTQAQDFARKQADHFLPDFNTNSLDAKHTTLMAVCLNGVRFGLASTAQPEVKALVEALEEAHECLTNYEETGLAYHRANAFVAIDNALAAYREAQP